MKTIKIMIAFALCVAFSLSFSANTVHTSEFFYENEEIAVKAGYRPCAKCMCDEYNKWKEENEEVYILVEENWIETGIIFVEWFEI